MINYVGAALVAFFVLLLAAYAIGTTAEGAMESFWLWRAERRAIRKVRREGINGNN